MKKAKRKIKEDQQEVVEGFVERNIETPAPSGTSRITIHVNEDHTIDWDKTQPGTDDRLLDAVTGDPTMLEKIASHPDFQESAADGKITSEEAGLVLDVLTQIEGMIFSSVSKKFFGMKVDMAIVGKHFKLNEEDHLRQDPLAAQGLQQLMDLMKIDPRYSWALFLAMAHGSSLARNVKACIIDQYNRQDITPPNPATQPPDSTRPN